MTLSGLPRLRHASGGIHAFHYLCKNERNMIKYSDLKAGESLINIKIETTAYCSLFATCGRYTLFQFEYRTDEDKWYFWPNTDFNPTIFEGSEFPMEYFINLCKAKYFCITGTDEWPTYVNVANKKYLKVAPSM